MLRDERHQNQKRKKKKIACPKSPFRLFRSIVSSRSRAQLQPSNFLLSGDERKRETLPKLSYIDVLEAGADNSNAIRLNASRTVVLRFKSICSYYNCQL